MPNRVSTRHVIVVSHGLLVAKPMLAKYGSDHDGDGDAYNWAAAWSQVNHRESVVERTYQSRTDFRGEYG
jgi:hypothetical protein